MLTSRPNAFYLVTGDEVNALTTVQTSAVSPAVFYAYAVFGLYGKSAESARRLFAAPHAAEGNLLRMALDYVDQTVDICDLLKVSFIDSDAQTPIF